MNPSLVMVAFTENSIYRFRLCIERTPLHTCTGTFEGNKYLLVAPSDRGIKMNFRKYCFGTRHFQCDHIVVKAIWPIEYTFITRNKLFKNCYMCESFFFVDMVKKKTLAICERQQDTVTTVTFCKTFLSRT